MITAIIGIVALGMLFVFCYVGISANKFNNNKGKSIE